MRNINWAVKISNIVAADENPDKGLYDDGLLYAFKWVLKSTASGYTGGILKDPWSTGFSNTVDIKRMGKMASQGGGKINLDNTTGLYLWIKTNGINITGKKIQLIEINTDTSAETVLYTGVTGESLDHDAKTITISYKSISSNRNAKITAPIPGKDNQYYPAVFGELDKTKFVNETDIAEEIYFTTEDAYLTFQVSEDNPSPSTKGTEFYLLCSEQISLTSVINLDLMADTGKLYVKAIAGDGADVIRQVESVSSFGSPITTVSITLVESVGLDDGIPEWVENETYLKFYEIEYINTADKWGNIQGFQDTLLYTFPNNSYVNIPLYNGNFLTTPNSIQLISDDLKDWGKVSGFEIIKPISLVSGTDAISDPSDLSGITGVWTYYSSSKAWSLNSDNTDTGLHNDSAIDDQDYSTFASTLFSRSGGIPGVNSLSALSVYKITFNPFSANNIYLALALDREAYAIPTFTDGSFVSVVSKNNFENTEIVKLLTDGSATIAKNYLMNYDKDYLSNYAPPSEFQANQNWWALYSNGFDRGGIDQWFSGYQLIEIDAGANPLRSEIPVYYICIFHNCSRLNAGSLSIDAKIRQLSLITKIDDIDFTKGLYAKWWGRNTDSPDFGVTSTSMIRVATDIYNHICRLQNYEADGETAPSEGWGIDYINRDVGGYDHLLDNSTVYGGLQYLNLLDWGIYGRQINKPLDLDTVKLKSTMLKDMWAIGAIDSNGREKMFPMFKAFDNSMSRVTINYENYKDLAKLNDRPVTDIFCKPYVSYKWDEGSQKYLEEIRITNVEQPIFDPSYVQGDFSDTIKEELWDKAKILYDQYGVFNDAPESIAKCPWILDSSSAIIFIRRWLEWQGATDDGFKDRREVSFTVPYEFAVENNLDVGSLIEICIPFDNCENDALGVITKINHDLKVKNPKCKVTAYIEITIPIITNDIDESGSRPDNIDESGSRADDIDESGSR